LKNSVLFLTKSHQRNLSAPETAVAV
jgi:hypothetical protein